MIFQCLEHKIIRTCQVNFEEKTHLKTRISAQAETTKVLGAHAYKNLQILFWGKKTHLKSRIYVQGNGEFQIHMQFSLSKVTLALIDRLVHQLGYVEMFHNMQKSQILQGCHLANLCSKHSLVMVSGWMRAISFEKSVNRPYTMYTKTIVIIAW